MIATCHVHLVFLYVTGIVIQAGEGSTNYGSSHYAAAIGLQHPEITWTESQKGDAKIWFDSYKFGFFLFLLQSSDSIVTRLRAGKPRSQCSIPGNVKKYVFSHLQTGFGAYPASYTMGTGDISPGGGG
jgi:hypothetical protein